MMTDDWRAFEHRVCLDLGGMTVEEMRARMTHVELLEWAAFYKRRKVEADMAKALGG